MRNKPIQADQLIPTSATPPPEAGFYRIDRHTIGVVGNMSFRNPDTQVVMPVGNGAIPFPNFTPRLLAALVTSSTAACTSRVVTVTATAHGIPATLFDGYEVYYPGSPTLAAGWYGGLSRTSADTLTFSAPSSADFGSESVNAGAIVSSEVTFCSVDLPANAIQPGDIVSIRTFRHGDAISSLKILRARLGGSNMAQHNISTSAVNGITSLAFAAAQANKQDGIVTIEGSLSATRQQGTLNTSTSLALAITGQLAVAAQYLAISAAKIRIE